MVTPVQQKSIEFIDKEKPFTKIGTRSSGWQLYDIAQTREYGIGTGNVFRPYEWMLYGI